MMLTILKRSKDHQGLAAFKVQCFFFWYEDQMSYIKGNYGEGKFPVEDMSKNEKVDLTENVVSTNWAHWGSCCICIATKKNKWTNVKVNIKLFVKFILKTYLY